MIFIYMKTNKKFEKKESFKSVPRSVAHPWEVKRPQPNTKLLLRALIIA